ncbi:MAG: phosphodiester glycosidase family protein [Oscillospiraceae bacterium]|nr:phosphodiester glycosidase family protein [Oscillospiraceae bacterium]
MGRKGLLSVLMALALLPWAQGAAGARDWGAPVDSVSADLGGGAVMYANTYWTGGDYRAEQYVELSPGASSVKPSVASLDTLCSAAPLGEVAAEYEEAGKHVVAAVNGGFFSTDNYAPIGLVVREGVLRYLYGGYEAIGFRADGSAVYGDPAQTMALRSGAETVSDAMTLNAPLGPYLTLYTAEAGEKTMAKGEGWNIVCALDRDLPMAGEVALTVERVETFSGPAPVPEGGAVLSFAGDIAGEAPAWISARYAGEELTLSLGCAPGWEDIESGLGLMFPLVRDGAAVYDGKDTANQPRSAVGLRPDGTLILYTLDGRRPGHSVGAGLDALARRMVELGCVYAGALDGGGSTNLSAVLPGEREIAQVNRSSGSAVRDVVNYIFLSTEARPTGTAARLVLYPLDIDALPGAEVELTVRAVDGNGYPAPVPEGLSFDCGGLGSVENGTFVAENPGRGALRVSAPGCEGVSIPVTVVESPDTLRVYGEVYRRQIRSLELETGQEVDLYATADDNHVSLSCGDGCFTWALDPALGSVDESGHITAAARGAEGTLTVSAGEQRVEIPIRVLGLPFEDVPADSPRYEAIEYVYKNNIFAGTAATVFEPDTVMTRAMLVTVLWRVNGSPAPEAPAAFADVPEGEWYAEAVAWASEAGLVAGYSPEAFGPMDDLTREQIITILHRWAGSPEAELSVLDELPDAGEESPYALTALRWALGPDRELLPLDEGYVRPRAPMPRADVAETLARYLSAQT